MTGTYCGGRPFIESVEQVGSISEGEPLSIGITLAPGLSGMDDIPITLSFSKEEIPSRREIFNGKKTTYTVSWQPEIAKLSEEMRQQGETEINLPVTVILSYRQEKEMVRLSSQWN